MLHSMLFAGLLGSTWGFAPLQPAQKCPDAALVPRQSDGTYQVYTIDTPVRCFDRHHLDSLNLAL